MTVVLQTAGSKNDLLEIGRFIASESKSIDVALKFLDKIEQKCLLYASQPLMGAARFDLGHNVHTFPVDKYVVFYRPLNEGIQVLLVVHSSRNLPSILTERLGEPNS